MNAKEYLAALDRAILDHERMVGFHQEAMRALRSARRLFLKNSGRGDLSVAEPKAAYVSPFGPLRKDLLDPIVGLLQDSDQGMTAAELSERLGLGTDGRALRTTLQRMNADGLVRCELQSGGGTACRWYRVSRKEAA